jgi:hypothetical protein
VHVLSYENDASTAMINDSREESWGTELASRDVFRTVLYVECLSVYSTNVLN